MYLTKKREENNNWCKVVAYLYRIPQVGTCNNRVLNITCFVLQNLKWSGERQY